MFSVREALTVSRTSFAPSLRWLISSCEVRNRLIRSAVRQRRQTDPLKKHGVKLTMLLGARIDDNLHLLS